MTVRTLLGFPDPLPDDQRVSTGIEELDRRLLRWLDLREGERFAYRRGDLCILDDRGYRRAVKGKAYEGGASAYEGGASAYEDSVRKGLQIMIDRDFFEARTGRLPRDDE